MKELKILNEIEEMQVSGGIPAMAVAGLIVGGYAGLEFFFLLIRFYKC